MASLDWQELVAGCVFTAYSYTLSISVRKRPSQVALRRFLCWLASLLGSVPRCPPIALLRPLCQTLAPSSCNVAGPQDQIMLELENALVSFYCQTVSCDVNALLPLLSRYRLCLRLPVVQLPQFTEQITSTPNSGPHVLPYVDGFFGRPDNPNVCIRRRHVFRLAAHHGQIFCRLRRSMYATRSATASRVLFWELLA